MASSASIRDVAALAGVSVGTVSNVLNNPGKVAPETVARVQQAIETLGFVRNDAARQLRAGSSRAIGLISLDVRNPFFTDLARGAEAEAALTGHSVVMANSDEKAELEASHIDLFETQRVHGVLISPFGDVAERLWRLRQRGIGAVLVDRTSADPRFSSVSVDDVVGGELATAHLLERGRIRIAFVGGPMAIRQVGDRLEGARRAVAARPGATLEVIEVSALSFGEGRRAGEQIVARDPTAWPDAVFAANDLVAIGFLQALFTHGIDVVPQRVALIGYDDIDFAAAAAVPLSSIRQPTELIGRTAVRMLLAEAQDRAAAPQRVVFQPELVVRVSTSG